MPSALVVAISFPSEIQRIMSAFSEVIVIVSSASSTVIDLTAGLVAVATKPSSSRDV